MKIELLSLSLDNFKAETKLFNFAHTTNIYGANGVGKSRLYDSFLWLLFGKDSQGRVNYEIKKRFTDKSVETKGTNSVTGVFLVDGKELTLKRTYSEKWEKKRGSSTDEYKGNQTSFQIDGVPKTETEYNAYVSSIIDESIFRLICSTTYFNNLKWQDRRTMLIQAAGEPFLEEICGQNKEFLKFAQNLSGKSLDDFRKVLKAKKGPIKDEIDKLGPMIEQEKTHIISIEDPSEKIKSNDAKIKSLEDQISGLLSGADEANKDVNAKISALYNQITALETEKLSIENELKSEYNKNIQTQENEKRECENSIRETEINITKLKEKLSRSEAEIADYKTNLTEIGKEYTSAQNNEIESVCPTCGSQLSPELFEEKKSSILKEILERGQSTRRDYDDEVLKHTEIGEKLISETEKLTQLKYNFQQITEKRFKHYTTEANENPRHREVIALIDKAKKDIEEISSFKQEAPDSTELREQIKTLRDENDKLKQDLFIFKKTLESQKKVEDMEEKQRNLSIELSELEKTEITAEEFTKAKIGLVTDRVNSLFKFCQWEMYETQVNGGEKEICECMVNGVPYGATNSANKANAGLDIANTFSRIYNLYAPIWADNRESVTELIPTDSQLINLFVSPSDKTLRFE